MTNPNGFPPDIPMDTYETVMFWASLYPHTIGDQLLKEIMEGGA